MLRILVFIAIASALAFGAVWLAERPGEVSVVWGGYTIETTVAMAAIGVVMLVLLGMMAWSILRFMLGLPTAFAFASRSRKRARGFEAVSRGMVAIGAGDPAAARRHATDARKLIANEPLTLLLTAQAAQLSGDKPAADAAFKQMLDEPATRVLGLRGLFVEARRRGDQIAARAFADEAVRLSPSLAWANDALLEFHSTAGEWEQARIAVERRAALRLSDKTESRRHRAVLLAAEAIAKESGDPAGALVAALDAVKLEPGLTPAAALAGRLLSGKGELRKATKVLEAAWREQPHPDLAKIYVHMRQGDAPGDRLIKAQALMKLRPTDAESAFAVAEAAIETQNFAKAREALLPLLAAVPTVRGCLLMARIEDAEHGRNGRGREWLTRSTNAPRDSVWVADGVVSETWLPVSPVSGRLDAFVWTLPPPILGSSVPAFDDWQVQTPIGDMPPVEVPDPRATALEVVSPKILPAASAVALADVAVPAQSSSVASPPLGQSGLVADAVPAVAAEPETATAARLPWYAKATEDHAKPEPAAPAFPADVPAPTLVVPNKADSEPAPEQTNEAGVSLPGTKEQDGQLLRLPDDPGPEAEPEQKPKRSFWGFLSR